MTAAQHSTNPMDNIHVRPLRFDFSHIQAQDPVWSRTHPLFSIYINALGVHIPYFERYLMMAFRSVREEIQDPQLKKDTTSIIGQEAHHGRNFIEFNKFLAKRYPEVEGLDKRAKTYFESSLKNDSIKAQIGYIAGYETFTYLGGMIILDGYDKWMKEADPVIRSMWIWHQVEEVEHGAVAFEAYQHLFGEDEWYRKYMVVVALLHILRESHMAFAHMIGKEGTLSNPWKALKAYSFFWRIMLKMANLARPVFVKGYSPRRHPMVNKRQNPVAKAWRSFEGKGGAVAKIDRVKMEEIMAQGLAK